jgi:hypothetical protein
LLSVSLCVSRAPAHMTQVKENVIKVHYTGKISRWTTFFDTSEGNDFGIHIKGSLTWSKRPN